MGIVRPVDKMGRVVIPKEIRKQLDIKNDLDSFDISMEGNTVVMRKYQPVCVFCNKLADNIKFQGITVCKECIEKIKTLDLSFEENT